MWRRCSCVGIPRSPLPDAYEMELQTRSLFAMIRPNSVCFSPFRNANKLRGLHASRSATPSGVGWPAERNRFSTVPVIINALFASYISNIRALRSLPRLHDSLGSVQASDARGRRALALILSCLSFASPIAPCRRPRGGLAAVAALLLRCSRDFPSPMRRRSRTTPRLFRRILHRRLVAQYLRGNGTNVPLPVNICLPRWDTESLPARLHTAPLDL